MMKPVVGKFYRNNDGTLLKLIDVDNLGNLVYSRAITPASQLSTQGMALYGVGTLTLSEAVWVLEQGGAVSHKRQSGIVTNYDLDLFMEHAGESTPYIEFFIKEEHEPLQAPQSDDKLEQVLSLTKDLKNAVQGLIAASTDLSNRVEALEDKSEGKMTIGEALSQIQESGNYDEEMSDFLESWSSSDSCEF